MSYRSDPFAVEEVWVVWARMKMSVSIQKLPQFFLRESIAGKGLN